MYDMRIHTGTCTRLISEDNEFGLFGVVMFRRVADEFKSHAREKK